MASGDILAHLKLDKKAYSAALKEALAESKAFSASLGGASVKIPAPDTTKTRQINSELKEQMQLARAARDAISDLRVAFERGDLSRDEFIRDSKALDRELVELRDTALTLPAAISSFNRALGTNARGLATAQGQISKLGLSQQVAIGLNDQFAQSLASSGRLGQVGALGITAYGGAMTGAGIGAAALGAGVLGVGVGTAALVQRGIRQVKAYQNAINILASSGEEDLGRFRGELTRLQEEGGRAAQAFSRSQLAGALAETVKAGVDANDALTLLKTGTQLASAEQEDLAGSTALVLKNTRQFNLEVGEAARVGDALAKSGLLAAGSARGLSEGLATVGPVAAAAGLTIEETLGLLVNLDNKGLDAAQEGATGLRSILSTLAKPSEPAKQALDALGVSLVNLDGSSKGVKQRLFEVRDAIAASGKDLTEFAAISDTQALTALLALDKSTDDYTRKIQDSTGALVSFADQQANGVTPAQQRAKAAMDDLASTAAEVFAPAIAGGADKVAALIRNLDSLVERGGDASSGVFEMGSNIRRAFGGDEVKLLEADLRSLQAQIDLKKEDNKRLDSGTFLGLPVPGVLRANNEALIQENNALIAQLETQATKAQTQLDVIQGRKAKGGSKPKPAARDIIPAVTAEFDQGLADYIKELQNAEDSAASAQVSAMEQGAAKVEAQRQLDLAQAKRAFDAQVAGLKEGSERYNGFAAAYATETAAINTRANRDLEADADTKLKTAQTLRERIDRVSDELSNAQTRGTDNPIKQIAAQFRVTSQAIKKETDDLLTGVSSALEQGAVSAEDAQALILQINADARGREVQAERTKNAEIKKVQSERKTAAVKLAQETAAAVQGVLETQAKALTDAQIASLEGTIPQLQATFKAEQDERARNFATTLEGFKGSNTERIGLVKNYNATEALLSRTHQVQLNQQERTALESYLTTVRDYQTQVAAARQKARQDEIANAQALNTARAASAQGQIDAGDTSGYAALIAAQRDAVQVAKELTQATRERGATASEVISALSAEAEAQRGVVSAVQGQIDALKMLRDKQLETISSGSQVLEYARAAAELSGRDLNERDAGDAIRAQAQAQLELFRAQVEANKPLAERLDTLKLIQQSEKELVDLGQRSGLTSGDKQLISEDAAASLDAYPDEAADALAQIKSLDAQIAQLGVTLQDATGELGTLLEAAGSGESLNIKVAVKIDRGALDAAEKTLRDTFGDASGNHIVTASTNAGTRAGAGLIGAFTSGITRNRGGLLAEVDRLLQQVRDRLPSSDAKTGPLSDLTYSGGKLSETFAAGMVKKRGSVISAAEVISRAAKPSVMVPNIPTTRPAYFAGAAGAESGTVNNYNTTVQNTPTQTTGLLGMSARQLAQDVQRELRVRGV